MKSHDMAQDGASKVLAFAQQKGVGASRSDSSFCVGTEISRSLEPAKNQRQFEYELLSRLSLDAICPFQLGYELGEYLMSDPSNFNDAEAIVKQSNLASGLVTAYQFVTNLFTFTRFDFSFASYFINVRSSFIQPDGELITELPLRYLILGRNLSIMSALHRATMVGEDISVVSMTVDVPVTDSMTLWAQRIGSEIAYEENCQVTRFDSRKLKFKYFLLNQIMNQWVEDSSAKQSPESSIPEKVLALFNDSNSYNLSKEQVAQSLNLSARTLGRRLQEEGTSWRKLVSEFRIDRAKELLSEIRSEKRSEKRSQNRSEKQSAQPMSLQQVADTLGFSSLSAFSSAFSKAEGISPSEFVRRQSRVLSKSSSF